MFTSFSFMNYNFPGSSTLPKSKPKVPAPMSPGYKTPVTPPVYVPKETNAPPPSFYPPQPAYVAPAAKSPVPTYTKQPSYTAKPAAQSYTPQPSYTPACTTPKVDINSLDNFNTAARGWQKSQSFYRPVTFNKQTYSDF